MNEVLGIYIVLFSFILGWVTFALAMWLSDNVGGKNAL